MVRTLKSLYLCLQSIFLLLPYQVIPVVAQTSTKGDLPNRSTGRTDSATVLKIPIERYTLANGLHVILHIDRKLPIVHTNLWFHVGSKNERIGRSGFAHFFEHLMFQGSKNAVGEYFKFVEKAGGNTFEGGVNGTTNRDRTNYFETVPSGRLEYLLWLESDRLATLMDVLTKEKIDNQRDVVKNERRQSYDNQPYGRQRKLLAENLYPYGHPYAHDVIGSYEDLNAASADDVKEFFRTYYTPNNLSIVIAGDFEVAEAKRLVEKYFGGIAPGPPLDRPTRWIPRLDGEKVIETKDRVRLERTYFAWHTPALFDPEDAELDLASTILTDGWSARLNRVLIHDKQLCSQVSSNQSSMEISGQFVLWATARPGVPLSQVEQIVTEEIARFAKDGPTQEEVDRAKTKWEYRFVTGLERIGVKADRLNSYYTYLGDPDKFQTDIERYRNATLERIRDAVGKWLNTRNRVVIRFRPEGSGRESSVALDRSKEPPLGADTPFQAPQVKTAKLDNDLEVLVVERSDLPTVAVTLAVKAGAVNDPNGKDGLADLMVATVKRGTKTRGSLEVEDALGDLGTLIGGSVGQEQTSLSFQVLKRNLAPALTIFADVVRNPAFPQSEVDREKKQRLDTLSQEDRNPELVAYRIGRMLAFGADHPYGRPWRGRPATIQQITREDFLQFHDTYWKPGGSALIFVGDISLAEASDLARKNFEGWSGGRPPAITFSKPRPVGPGKTYLIDRQDAAQTQVEEILPGLERKSEDYYALQLVDAVWGGVLNSRLMLNLRESKGYSYAAWSLSTSFSKAGVWEAWAAVQTDKTTESVVEFVKELKFLAGEKPISDEELAHAKATRVRGYAQQFESLNRIADQIAAFWAADLPMSEMQRETRELAKVTLASVNAVAQKYAAPSGVTLLLVGDLSKIEAGVRTLNLGEVVILDLEGKPVVKK